jgi:hypothetical protein
MPSKGRPILTVRLSAESMGWLDEISERQGTTPAAFTRALLELAQEADAEDRTLTGASGRRVRITAPPRSRIPRTPEEALRHFRPQPKGKT